MMLEQNLISGNPGNMDGEFLMFLLGIFVIGFLTFYLGVPFVVNAMH